MSHKEKALHLFSDGYLCSQSVLGAFAEEYKLPIWLALQLGTCFGAGMRKGEVWSQRGSDGSRTYAFSKNRMVPAGTVTGSWMLFKKQMDHSFATNCLAVTFGHRMVFSMHWINTCLRSFVRKW